MNKTDRSSLESPFGEDFLTEEERKKSYMTQAILQKKRKWYSKVPLNLKQMDVILIIAGILLVITIMLIVLEATGVFYLFPKQ